MVRTLVMSAHKQGLFLAKVSKDADGCWNWTAFKNPCGYGMFKVRNYETRLAHRCAYETWVGKIPVGTELDHLCKNRACVNPAHLEAVPHAVNVQRGDYTKAFCVRGHASTPENRYYTKGKPGCCKLCHKMHRERYRKERNMHTAFRWSEL